MSRARSTPLLSDLREPPVVGQFYLVPVVRAFPYLGHVADWPVIGPKHRDVDFFAFKDDHYHVDARFLTAYQERRVMTSSHSESIEFVVGHAPLCDRFEGLPKGRPALVRRKCRRESYGYVFGHQPAVKALRAHYGEKVEPIRAHYGEKVEPIRLHDGRILCPHRKADLTQFPPDAEGMVICPLHGLKICVGAAAEGTEMSA